MNLFALTGALLLGYYRPLKHKDWLKEFFAPFAKMIEQNFNGGQYTHGVIAWFIASLLPSMLVGVAYYSLQEINAPLGLALGIVVLYLTLRFSQFGQHAEQIIAALRDYNIDQARLLLSTWEGSESNHYTANQIAVVSIETIFRRAHHGLFAPIFWFALLGPAGALLYRLSHLLKSQRSANDSSPFYQFSDRMFNYMEWLPARVTGAAFAVVGDFEDAVYCWRTQAALWPDKFLGIILASGAGALGVRLGESLPYRGIIDFRPELGLGDEADADYLQSAVGLVWRVLILMLGLLVLLTFAHWLGR